MEVNADSFDPTQHRMLEDNKSWVSKSVPEFDWTPPEVKYQYNGLVDKAVAANPDLSPQQAIEKIEAIEKKFDHQFFGAQYSDDPNRRLVNERNRLASLDELNLVTADEKKELDVLRTAFAQAVKEVVDRTQDDPIEIQKGLDTALLYGVAQDLLEAKTILIEGPIVSGFEETKDVRIPNETIGQFLKTTFGEKTLRKAKVGRITKDDKFLIYRGYNDQHIKEGNELLQKGVATWDGGMLIAPDRERYLQAEMQLESADDPSKLKHLYKIRATAGNSQGFHQIQLRSFGIERSQDFDYLADVGLESEEDKMRAYILGTVAHEVAHRYESQLERGVFDEYKQIMEAEVSPHRTKYVSDYVAKHEVVYGSNGDIIFGEDFAEAVRIFVTNPNYLQQNYPQRYTFVEQNFPFIKPGTVINAVRDIK